MKMKAKPQFLLGSENDTIQKQTLSQIGQNDTICEIDDNLKPLDIVDGKPIDVSELYNIEAASNIDVGELTDIKDLLPARRFTRLRVAVLNYLAMYDSQTAKSISTNLGISLITVKRALNYLVLYGYIKRQGNNRSGKWRVIKTK